METNHYIIVWIMGSIACGIAGSYRQIGPVFGFIAGLLLSPIFGMGVVLSTANNKQIEMIDWLIDVLTEDEENTE